MFTRILVPLDGSARAERALPVAARLARSAGGTVILASIVSPMVSYGPLLEIPTDRAAMVEADVAAAKDYLGRVVAGDKLASVKTQLAVSVARPVAPELLQVATASHADIVVMCSHGRTGMLRWALGSVARQLVRSSPVPVLVLQADGPVPLSSGEAPDQPLRIEVPLDGSSLAETAVEPAARLAVALAGSRQAMVRLVHVVEHLVLPYAAFAPIDGRVLHESDTERGSLAQKARLYLHTVAQRFTKEPLASLRVQVTSAVVFNQDAASAIVAVGEGSEDVGAPSDIIAMATHGRTGIQRLAIGSITERVLQSTKRPLFVVRPIATESVGEPALERAREPLPNGVPLPMLF
jgi:nucleotide-binding universal stress UspA family protein